MRKLSFIIGLVGLAIFSFGQSPHGDNFKMDCATCHSPESWEVVQKEMTFDHSKTGFDLTGQHLLADCKSCHTDLKFTETKSECISCHTDMHNNTLGADCNRCHTTKSWIVANTTEMHQMGRFPLMGSHAVADCFQCHESATNLQFDPLSIACVDCHRNDYLATTHPNHQSAGYSTDCIQCHSVKAVGWTSTDFEHNFFPLNGGHAISCAECHTSGTFGKISNECISCHQTDFNSTKNPNHQLSGFSENCSECHSLNPGWKPAEFKPHDAMYFPIYSGEHKNEWNSCADCHTNSSNYAEYSCLKCHEHNQSSMDLKHATINGYSYRSNMCYACHPSGDKSSAFSHDATGFPLTGAHTTVDCTSCHTNGFSGLSASCSACHQTNFDNTTNPNHTTSGFPNTCEVCHTTTAWQPSSYDHSLSGFPLTGGHSSVSCAACHNGNYTNMSSTCSSCHTTDFNNTTNPNHTTSGFPNTCEVCHTTTAWQPASYDHSSSGFPLTGAHKSVSCAACHNGNYTNTSSACVSCHTTDFNSTTNPNHKNLNFPTDCESCHTTSAWQPSTFNHDGQYFPIYSGKHRGRWSSCSDCHTLSTNYGVFSCITCHEHNQTSTNADHSGVRNYVYNSTSCYTCHPTGSD